MLRLPPLHFSSVKQGGIVPVLVRRLAVTDPVHFSSVKHGCLRALPDAGVVSTPLHFSSVKQGGFEPRRDPLHFSSVKHCCSCPSWCVGGLSLTPCTSPQLSTAVFVPLLMLLVVSAPLHFSSVKQGGSEPRREGPCFMVSSSCHGVGVVPLQLCPTSSMTP